MQIELFNIEKDVCFLEKGAEVGMGEEELQKSLKEDIDTSLLFPQNAFPLYLRNMIRSTIK